MSPELVLMHKPNQGLANQRQSRSAHSITLSDKENCCMFVVHMLPVPKLLLLCSFPTT